MGGTPLSGLPLALLVPVRVRVVADDLPPSVHEEKELPQAFVYKVGVRPQFVKAPPGAPQGVKLAFRLGPALVQLTQTMSPAHRLLQQ